MNENGDPVRASHKKKYKYNLVMLLLAAAFFVSAVFWLLYAGSVNLISSTRIMAAVAVTFPLMVISIVLIGVRLKLIVGPEVKHSEGIAVNAVAQLVGLIIPSRLSEMAKPIGLNLICGTPAGRGLVALAIERILDAFMLAALAALAAVSGPWRGSMLSSALVLASVVGMAVVAVGFLIVYPSFAEAVIRRLPSSWLRSQARHVVEGVHSLRNAHTLMQTVLLSIAAWILAYLIFLGFFVAAGYSEIGWSAILVIFVASTLGLIVAVAPGGLGTFEAAIVMSLAAYNVSTDEAVTLAVLMRLCLVLPVVATAGWFLLTSKMSLGPLLRQLATWKARL